MNREIHKLIQEEKRNSEGMLYKELWAFGKSFPLYYGYYEDCDRENPLVEPLPIYPDFQRNPLYTKEGYPFVTEMQDACSHYLGQRRNDMCYGCEHYRHGDEFLGVCVCAALRKNDTDKT